MGGTIVCIAAVLLGVDASWPPLPDGGRQYIVRIEPQVLDRLQAGTIEVVESEVPPGVTDIRTFRILLASRSATGAMPTTQTPVLGGADHSQWIRLPNGRFECRVWVPPAMLPELDTSSHAIEGTIPFDVDRPSLFRIMVGTKPSEPILPVVNDPADDNADPNTSEQDPGVPEPEGLDPAVAAPPPSGWPFSPAIDDPPLTERPDPLPSFKRPFAFDPPAPTVPTVVETEPSQPPAGAGVGSQPISVQPTNHVEPTAPKPNEPLPKNDTPNEEPKKNDKAEDPASLPLSPTLTLLALFVSLAGNLFLLWVMRDFRNRYRSLLSRVGEIGDVASSFASPPMQARSASE